MSQYAAFFSKNTKFRICLFKYPLKLPPKANVVMINQNCTWPTPHFCCNLLILFIIYALRTVKIGSQKPSKTINPLPTSEIPPQTPNSSSIFTARRSSFFLISTTRLNKIYSVKLDAYNFMTFVIQNPSTQLKLNH